MADYMVDFCKATKDDLTEEQQHLLMISFKNVVGQRRATLRSITLIEKKERQSNHVKNADRAMKYKNWIQKELYDKCSKLINLVSYDLIANCKAQEAEVFLQKMKGDFYRYQAEKSHAHSLFVLGNLSLALFKMYPREPGSQMLKLSIKATN